MDIETFLALPEEHEVSFKDGQELHKEIALKETKGLSAENCLRLRDYLGVCLLHSSIDPNFKVILEEKHLELSQMLAIMAQLGEGESS